DSPIEITTEIISSGGGKILISGTASELEGMELQVADGSYNESKEFKISYSDIIKHNLGIDFNPVTPVIEIDNGGGYSEQVMTLKIPIDVNSNEFAMAFYYDEASGSLEGIPIIAQTNEYVVIGTRHFSGSTVSSMGKSTPSKKNAIQGLADKVQIVVTKIIKDELLSEIKTDFEPGINDWEFSNKGSYIAPGGFCAGASITAMWYYLMYPNSKLFDKYKTVKGNVWGDNKVGIRFASEVQCDINWNQRNKFFDFMKDLAASLGVKNDSLQYFAFAYSMKISKQPQYVSILGPDGGHAMIIYKCDNGQLSVADPNYPNNTDGEGGKLVRSIKLGNPKFNPYESRRNTKVAPTLFPDIRYAAKTSMIEWETCQSLWDEVNNNVKSSKFPEYKIYFMEGNTKIELHDILNTDADSIKLFYECPTCQSQGQIGLNIIDIDGKYKQINDEWMQLQPGRNRLCFIFWGKPTQDCDGDAYTDGTWEWLDFRWIDIYRQSLEIVSDEDDGAPIDKAGKANKAYKFIADGKGSFPKNAKFVWNFGDGSNDVVVQNDSTCNYTYSKTGNYTLSCKVYDNSTNEQIAEGQVPVQIGGFTRFTICIADWTTQGDEGPIVSKTGFRINYLGFTNALELHTSSLNPVCEPLIWNNNKFSATINCINDSPYPYASFNRTGTIDGELSPDGKTLLYANVTIMDNCVFSDGDEGHYPRSISVQNVPVKEYWNHGTLGFFGNGFMGKDAEQYITSYSYSKTTIDWETGSPELTILFNDK
ncbi:PKD domain-containing protein, partial [Bacteroidota bacterium]